MQYPYNQLPDLLAVLLYKTGLCKEESLHSPLLRMLSRQLAGREGGEGPQGLDRKEVRALNPTPGQKFEKRKLLLLFFITHFGVS